MSAYQPVPSRSNSNNDVLPGDDLEAHAATKPGTIGPSTLPSKSTVNRRYAAVPASEQDLETEGGIYAEAEVIDEEDISGTMLSSCINISNTILGSGMLAMVMSLE